MLINTEIQSVLRDGKLYSSDFLDDIVSKESNGQNCNQERRKFSLLIIWLEILQRYLDYNFDSNGVIAEPDVVCLTEAQATGLIAKLKIMIGCGTASKYPQSAWILGEGYWNDNGRWIDTETWNDSAPWS